MGGFNQEPNLELIGASSSGKIYPQDDFTREVMTNPSESLIVGARNVRSLNFVLNLWKLASKVIYMERELASFLAPLKEVLATAKAIIERDLSKVPWTKNEILLIGKCYRVLNQHVTETSVQAAKILRNSEPIIYRAHRLAHKVRTEIMCYKRQRDPELSLGTIANYVDYALTIAESVEHVQTPFQEMQVELSKITILFIERCVAYKLQLGKSPFPRPVKYIKIECDCSNDDVERFYIRVPDSNVSDSECIWC